MSDLSPGKWMYRADLVRPINKLAENFDQRSGEKQTSRKLKNLKLTVGKAETATKNKLKVGIKTF